MTAFGAGTKGNLILNVKILDFHIEFGNGITITQHSTGGPTSTPKDKRKRNKRPRDCK